jgi:nicotinate-nucleotide pyrophosphorylase
MNNIEKKIQEAKELAEQFDQKTNQILNDPNTPQELKDIILEHRIPDDKIIDLSGGKRIKRIDPNTFEIEYE